VSVILVTGAAGFIGSAVVEALLKAGEAVVGLDNFNDYYDVALKRDRARRHEDRCPVQSVDISDLPSLEAFFRKHPIRQVCHLAAQAGVRYSLDNPFAYQTANIQGTLNLLELCRRHGVKSFVYASSSSVYGGNTKVPFAVEDPVDRPLSLYAATKRSTELMAQVYHHLYGLHCTGLRFFTVYGPWGRPDMALFKFTRAILEGNPIALYNHGKMRRDFTYISDIVQGVLAALAKDYPLEIFNLGNASPVELVDFVETIEKALGRSAQKEFLPLQPGDVPATWADIGPSIEKLGFAPRVPLAEGVRAFTAWYREYFRC
jgi:UDP-glucuronate 4-epimerase